METGVAHPIPLSLFGLDMDDVVTPVGVAVMFDHCIQLVGPRGWVQPSCGEAHGFIERDGQLVLLDGWILLVASGAAKKGP